MPFLLSYLLMFLATNRTTVLIRFVSKRAMYLRRKGGSSNQNILIIFSRAIAGFADGLMYPVKKNIILEMYSVHLYSMFSLFSLNWKVIPVYVAETASKDLRSSMNNVTNISQVL